MKSIRYLILRSRDMEQTKLFIKVVHLTQKMTLKGEYCILNVSIMPIWPVPEKKNGIYFFILQLPREGKYLQNTAQRMLGVFCLRKLVFGICTLVPKQHLQFPSKHSKISLYITYPIIQQSADIRRKTSFDLCK